MSQRVYIDEGFLVVEDLTDNQNFSHELGVSTIAKILTQTDSRTKVTLRLSNVIYDLLSKKWIEKNSLYVVAQIIDSHCPEHEIDWVETFRMVERKFYLKAVDNLEESKKPRCDGSAKSVHLKMTESLNRAIEEDRNVQIQSSIAHAVQENLSKYGLRPH